MRTRGAESDVDATFYVWRKAEQCDVCAEQTRDCIANIASRKLNWGSVENSFLLMYMEWLFFKVQDNLESRDMGQQINCVVAKIRGNQGRGTPQVTILMPRQHGKACRVGQTLRLHSL